MQTEMEMHAKHALLLHAKSFLASPKNYLAARRQLAAMGTQVSRWSDLQNHNPEWDERTKLMAGMVRANTSVLEFGSGREMLGSFLPPGCTYQPADLAPRSPRTLVCDLNQGFPQLKQRYDFILFSGVIEYIHDLDSLMQHVRQHCAQCIVSYATTDNLDCITTRSSHGWVHHYSDANITELFRRAGFHVSARTPWQQQTIYQLQ